METSPNVRYHHNIPDQPKSGRMEKEKCLQELITALLHCHENYKALSVITQLAEVKSLFNNYADERADYAYTLYSNLDVYKEAAVNENGNVIGLVNTVLNNTGIARIYGDVDIFQATITSELESVKRYDIYLRNHIPIIPHLRLLTSQKSTIKRTIKFLSESINLY